MEKNEIILIALAALGLIAIRVARTYSQKKKQTGVSGDDTGSIKSKKGEDDYEPYSGK